MVSSIPDDINQVLNAEKPYEFRKTKFDSIIFFLPLKKKAEVEIISNTTLIVLSFTSFINAPLNNFLMVTDFIPN
jgi:hypothetical protein